MEAWIDKILTFLAEMMGQNLWFAPALCLLAGILTSFTPCSLSAVPMALAYMEGTGAKEKQKAFRLSLTMAAGMAVTFGIFGVLASVIGHFMHEIGHWWTFLMGVLMVLMALQIWGVIRLFPDTHVHGEGHRHEAGEDCRECRTLPIKKKGYAGAFLTGALGGVFASHCAAPVMVALLALVAQSDHGAFWGVFLMVLYALGHSILLVLAGVSYSLVDGWMKNPAYARAGKGLRAGLGLVIFLLGVLLLWP